MDTILCSVPVEAPGAKLRKKRSEGDQVHPKIAITQLRNWTVKNNFPSPKFYDVDMLYPSDEEVEKFFIENNASIIGISAVVSTSYLQVKRLAQIIKKVNKNALIVCGGYLTGAAKTILRKTDVDICVVGDGEIAWVGILNFMKEHLEKGHNKFDVEKMLEIKGIAILDDDKNFKFSGFGRSVASCHMSFPDFDYYKSGLNGDEEALQNYFRPFDSHEMFVMDERSFEKNRKPMAVTMFSSKGCVAKCTFCQRVAKGYFTYDLDKLEKHVIDVKENYNVGFILFSDENFGSNRKYAHQVAELMQKHNILWFASGVRVKSVNEEDIIHFKKNGCVGLKFGIETGSQTMLDIMEKKCNVEDIKKALWACFDNNLFSLPTGFMIGMPGENIRTCRESGKLMGEIAAKIKVPLDFIFKHVDISYALPLIGTPLYEYGKQFGLIGSKEEDEEKYLELTSDVAPHKRYFINFNGAPMSEVIFWDILVYLEAMRTYVKLMKNKTEDAEMKKKFQILLDVQEQNPQVFSKQKKIKILGIFTYSQYFVTNFLRKHIIFNKKIAKLPRFMVDPIVRYMLYFEYLIQKHVLKDTHNLHAFMTNKKSSKNRITENEVDPAKTSQKDRSLRTIVQKRLEAAGLSKEQKLYTALTFGP
tara:strand:- start:4245 stop:6176 length:1932 start_codon:yes stop_codon:yes gene_type:complete